MLELVNIFWLGLTANKEAIAAVRIIRLNVPKFRIKKARFCSRLHTARCLLVLDSITDDYP
ncbi:MAG: hypothetical protein BGO64_11270 [Aeromonas sp. 62-46]|nr:MAG: hypothetical protein BGO64_11270 [Aeromonas sp. 62-46]